MINKPTVLVLGAGASQPYGFPLGRELLFKVIQGLEEGRDIRNGLLDMGFDPDLLDTFQEELHGSMQLSVDAFLERRAKDTEWVEVGKLAIAWALMPCEKETLLLPKKKQKWYEHLFAKIADSPNKFRKNRLSVITFNYDRSFEQFLFLGLKNSFGLDDEDAIELVESVPIVHVHGQLGPLPWEEDGRPYDDPQYGEEIEQAAAGIRIVHEAATNDSVYKKARGWLTRAEVVAFLGFGYHGKNVARLRLDASLRHMPKIYACAFGLRGHERESAVGQIPGLTHKGSHTEDVLTFLRLNPILE